MPTSFRRICSSVALGSALLVGCHDYLAGPSLGANDPNNVANLTDPGPLYIGIEAAQMENYTSQFARFMAMYTQQIAGVARQQQGFDLYVVGPGATNGIYDAFYAAILPSGGGGAADARKVQVIANAQHDSIYVGIAMIWEAMMIGDAASIFGAVPYSQAFDRAKYPTPAYDPQLQVFSEVQQTLSTALVYLNCDTKGATNLGPTGVLPRGIRRTSEIIYAGLTPDSLVTVYKQVAHTLKARYYLHAAAVDPTNYAQALAEAQLGIAAPSVDWNWYANGSTGSNRWVDFMGARGDIGPGAALIHLMKSRIASGLDIDNGRFNMYFADGSANSAPCVLSGNALQPDSGCTGFRPGGNAVLPFGGGFSSFNIFNNDGSFEQPAVTYTETQLIIAEAALLTGNAGLATTALTNVRSNEVYGADALDGVANCTPTCTFPAQPPVPATLRNIIEEKYIDLFAVPEVYNDYKRTCLPWLAPAPAAVTSAVTRDAIAARLPYSQSAIASDPHTPNVGATARNDDNPTACPTLTYSSTPAAW